MKPLRPSPAFTLVEVIVVAGLIVLLMVVLVGMTDQTQRLVKNTSSKVEQFQEARVAYESMTRKLGQATLNSFWDYEYPGGDHTLTPIRYFRNAELRFRSGPMSTLTGGVAANGNKQPGHGIFFNAPFGYVANPKAYIDMNAANLYDLNILDNLINTWGYFLEIGDDSTALPAFVTGAAVGVAPRQRYRLMELMQGSENLNVYTPTAQAPANKTWFDQWVTGTGLPAGINRPVRPLAENIVALIVMPRLSKSDEDAWMVANPQATPTPPPLNSPNSDYNYDSTNTTVADPMLNPRNQLPPVVQVIMVAIDEPSAQRLQDKYGTGGTAPDPLGKLGLDYSTVPATPPDTGVGLFKKAPTDQALLNPNQLLTDLAAFENVLIAKRVSYRIFNTNVSIRGAKWSKSQTN